MDIKGDDIVESVYRAAQFISYFHPADYIRHLSTAYTREESPAAKAAMAQILRNSRMSAYGRRPLCQDTGMIVVFAKLGMESRILSDRPLEDLVNEGVRRAYRDVGNPLRASMVADPIFERKNTRDNTPAVIHTQLVQGPGLSMSIGAKGGGSENKARFTTLNPAASIEDWVLATMPTLGAGWCPPGMIALGVGGSAEKAMLMAKEALNEPIDMLDLLERGPQTPLEGLRVSLYEKINALGIGAQGLGGMTTVVDVKIATYPTHAASKPVALIPQCAANRHVHFHLDGSGPAEFEPPALSDWPEMPEEESATGRRVCLDRLTHAEIAGWRAGETLLLTGRILTGRDAAHRRLADMQARGEPFPVTFKDRFIYYVGPVDAVGDEAVGPAGPTTATRMDGFSEMMLETGLLGMIGKAERGDATVETLARHGAVYLAATGGAAYLISKSIRSAKLLAFEDLGMEAIFEMEVEDMPVTVAVDATGQSIHKTGPALWRKRIAEAKADDP
ncbi:fumarate hydratase [Microvirga makkahensis]|uniref:Fumarate hydratase class I n=1 Tax=Microvirga makkahensis TaxID=1128670 RepID=A0A7X3MPC7_9HYPH|nr:fumarate hydratase [Microvirga makkahensis]MXQ10764.1 fumarate hydratase [Microvirga makkahensis]